jgi:hypothetical protein
MRGQSVVALASMKIIIILVIMGSKSASASKDVSKDITIGDKRTTLFKSYTLNNLYNVL